MGLLLKKTGRESSDTLSLDTLTSKYHRQNVVMNDVSKYSHINHHIIGYSKIILGNSNRSHSPAVVLFEVQTLRTPGM